MPLVGETALEVQDGRGVGKSWHTGQLQEGHKPSSLGVLQRREFYFFWRTEANQDTRAAAGLPQEGNNLSGM